MRLTMKAGKSSALTGFLSSRTTTSRTVRKVSSSVAMPRISSTKPINGTGFMKCMPMNLPGRSVTEARRVTEIDEVLVASSTLGGRSTQSFLKMSRFSCSFSVAASTIRSQSANGLKSVAVVMRLSAASLSSGRIMPRPIWRSMLRPMLSMPELMCGWSTSINRMSKPLRAQTCAMPLPIWPAPMTPMRLIMTRYSALFLCDRCGQFGHDLEQIPHDAVIGHLEDRSFLVLVDRHNGLRILHAGKMLDRAGDADGDIEVGRHHLAGLADLVVVRHVAGIDRGTAGPQTRAERVGELLEDLEVLAAGEATAARDDDLGAGELRPLALGELGADIGSKALGALAADLLDRSGTAAGRRLEVGRTDGDDLDLVGRLHGRHGVAGVDGPHEGVGRHDLDGLGDLTDIEQGRDARRQVLADRVGRHDDVAVIGGELHDQRRDVLGHPVGVGRVLRLQNLGDARNGGGRF